MTWRIVFTPQAKRDARKLAGSGLKTKAQRPLTLLEQDPFVQPPPYEKLRGDLAGLYSRRINIQHRLVYAVHPDQHTIKVVRLWTHYA